MPPAIDVPPDAGSRRRSDARRNIAAIVGAAAEALAHDPRASMQDVADACGLHRATVHRHFASREDLVLAVRDHLFSRAGEERDRIFAEVADPVAALAAYVAAMLDLGDQYRPHRFVAIVDGRNEGDRPASAAPVAAVLRRGQELGEVRADVEPAELAIALAGLIATVGPEIAMGRMTRQRGAALCLRLLSR